MNFHLSKFLNYFLELKDSIMDFVYPPHCLVCGNHLSKNQKDVCEKCWNSLGMIPHPFCPNCKSFFSDEKNRCLFCSTDSNLLYVRSLGIFDDFYRELIHKFKYKGKVSLGKRLSKKLGEEIRKDKRFSSFDFLIPVPLHPARKRERGYNQSEVMGEVISKDLNISFLKNGLKRIKNTKDQTKLNDEQRRKNVKDAFKISDSEIIKDKKIILVDDVITTGATLFECAKVLKNNGAKKIVGATLVLATS